jgi:hypothetical protein
VEPGDVTDLGDEHRREGPAHPADLLDHVVAGVVGQPGRDLGAEAGLVTVKVIDQVQQGPDPRRIGPWQRGLFQHPAAGHTEQVRHRDHDPVLGQHRMHLGLQPAADRDQLGAVPHQLA